MNIPEGANFRVGDKVRCHLGFSWVDGKTGYIKKVNVTSSDGVHGHLIQLDDSVSVVEPEFLELML